VARILLQATLAFALLGTGWTIARAQTPEPNFELVVDAPAGPTTITCVRGCTLMWVERGINPNGRPVPTFDFSCTGVAVQRCSSGKVGGWITP
jgi:hypothetical protein